MARYEKYETLPPYEVSESLATRVQELGMEEEERCEGAIAIECPKGSIPLWDGSVWHGSYPRQKPEERVVLHMTYSRLALRTVEDYCHQRRGGHETLS